MTDLLASDPDIEVIGTALDPFIAAKRMEDVVPDVITLDVEITTTWTASLFCARSWPSGPFR